MYLCCRSFFFFFFFPPHAVSSLQQGECWATGGRARERASKRIISAPCRKRKPETVWQTCRATETQHLGGEFLHLCETFNGVKCEVAAWKQLGPIHVLNAPLTHSTHVNTPGPPRGSRSPPHSYLRGLLAALLKARFEEKKKKPPPNAKTWQMGDIFDSLNSHITRTDLLGVRIDMCDVLPALREQKKKKKKKGNFNVKFLNGGDLS